MDKSNLALRENVALDYPAVPLEQTTQLAGRSIFGNVGDMQFCAASTPRYFSFVIAANAVASALSVAAIAVGTLVKFTI